MNQAVKKRVEAKWRRVLKMHQEALRAVDHREPLDQWMAAYYKKHREFGSTDRRFYSACLYAFFRWRGWLDGMTPPMQIWYAYLLESTVFEETHHVLSDLLTWPLPAAPPGNLNLSEKSAVLSAWNTHFSGLNERALLPDWYWDARPACLHDEASVQSLLSSFQHRSPVWLFVSGENAEVKAFLEHHACSPEQSALVETALRVDKPLNRTLLQSPIMGRVLVQDLSSQVVVKICAEENSSEWLDCCAGAGGKSLALALLQPETRITAIELRRSAARSFEKRLRRVGIHHIALTQGNILHGDPKGMGLFHGVLIDAPCSSTGTWGRNPDARWRCSSRDVEASCDKQIKLLDAASEKVRAGGCIVYAVCTLTHQETEGVVNRFLQEHTSFDIERVQCSPGLTDAKGCLWMMPWSGPCTGMFIAKLRKKK